MMTPTTYSNTVATTMPANKDGGRMPAQRQGDMQQHNRAKAIDGQHRPAQEAAVDRVALLHRYNGSTQTSIPKHSRYRTQAAIAAAYSHRTWKFPLFAAYFVL